ncbi:hypothetical protein QZH46_07055 [Pseudomonas corrugata]
MNVSAHAPVNLDIAACSDGVRQGGFIAYQPGTAGLFACLYRSLSLGYVDDKGRSVAHMQGALEANLIAERCAQSFN